ncbi:hypothetical protein [Chroococcidiopsis sp.]|uniref:hypothetical protein n=1 Tax=Chroococcidiopsis sp. TaxID=3088168 RepID=UPI003F2D2F0D
MSSFLQESDRRDSWYEEYYTYQRQPLHPAPTHINTPQLSLNLPQLTFEKLKQKYSQFWQEDSKYFNGGETNAITSLSSANATLDSFLQNRYQGYHWKLSRPWLAQKGATSHLSPHIAFGTISTRQVYQSTKARAAELANQPKAEFSLKAFRVSEA